MVAKIINIALRGVEFLWTLLIMALVGNMISESVGGNPSVVNYTMFVAVFSMLSLLYLFPATIRESLSIHPFIMVAVDLANVFFFFTCAIALAAELHVHSCNNGEYLKTNNVTNGSYNQSKRCHEAQANTAFLWFGFLAYTASAVLSFFQGRDSGSSRGGIRAGPSMSQV